MAVGTDCTVVVDWSCDSQHGNNGWRYCRSQPTSGTTNACERQVVHSAACGAPTIAPTQAPSTVTPTQAPSTVTPTKAPTTLAPQAPGNPTQSPTTQAPTNSPIPCIGSEVHVRGDWAQCWDAAGTIGAGNTAWHGTREDARTRCMAVGTDCTVVVDWSCDSQHGNNGWRYCRSQPTSGTTNACERQVVHSAACGAPTIAPTQAPSTVTPTKAPTTLAPQAPGNPTVAVLTVAAPVDDHGAVRAYRHAALAGLLPCAVPR
eukprot:gene1824-biopygen87147